MPTLVVSTTLGDIVIGLKPEAAPKTCEAIQRLATQGLYSGCCFYRAEPSFVVQAGLIKPSGLFRHKTCPHGGLPLEYKLPNVRGSVALARQSPPNSGKSEFFVNLKNNHALDKNSASDGYAVFGEVLEGMDVADKISQLPTKAKNGMKMIVSPVKIISVTVAK